MLTIKFEANLNVDPITGVLQCSNIVDATSMMKDWLFNYPWRIRVNDRDLSFIHFMLDFEEYLDRIYEEEEEVTKKVFFNIAKKATNENMVASQLIFDKDEMIYMVKCDFDISLKQAVDEVRGTR